MNILGTDHDLLIALATQVDFLAQQVGALQTLVWGAIVGTGATLVGVVANVVLTRNGNGRR